MKFIIFLGLTNLVCGINLSETFRNSAFGYHAKVGIPLAERIQRDENIFFNSRIVGGVPAVAGQYPFKAGLIGDIIGFDGVSVCGGSLIHPSKVATAAHCWNDGENQAWRFTVVLGSSLLFSGGTRLASSVVVAHPDWNPNLFKNDVAVIYLTYEVETSSIIAPIALPSGPELFENFKGEAAIAIGFGITSNDNGIASNQFLSHVRLTVISNNICNLVFPFILQTSNICTSGFGFIGTCGGDSGGPLIIYRNNEPILIGIASFGSALGCEIGLPSVYSRATSYVDFFNQHLKQ
ncbi:brachyurin-like [Bombyx mandarina]|uniref:Brachyurin-like n=1 Tax=Bombyx mandarina TaxID=7092 RepID=A0A6J2JYZ9_BOMMA|nr:brachyurin-like [Bombyx mandarina]